MSIDDSQPEGEPGTEIVSQGGVEEWRMETVEGGARWEDHTSACRGSPRVRCTAEAEPASCTTAPDGLTEVEAG